jgi:hypothetical protein
LASVLTVSVPRFLDTSALRVDVHPDWAQVIVKGKNLLVHLDAEVSVEASRVQRVKATGALVLTMPYVDEAAPLRAQKAQGEARARARAEGKPEGGETECVEKVGESKAESAVAASKPTQVGGSLNMLVGEQRETKVSKELQRERARKEQEELDARYARLALEEKRKEEEKAAKRAEALKRDSQVQHLADSLGVDMDELPDLE